MITAAVILLVSGFSVAIGYKWGSREATNLAAEEITNWTAAEKLEEDGNKNFV